MTSVPAKYDYLLNEDMRYDYLSNENRIKLINLILPNLTEYDKGRKNKDKATSKEMNYKRKFTNEFLQLIADIIIEHRDAGRANVDIWIYANITSIFNIIAYRDQYEGITRFNPLNNLYFLFLCNLYCNYKYYLNKKYRGTSISGTSISGTSISGRDFIHQFLFMFEQSGVTGMFYITKEHFGELFENKDGKYDCDPIEGSIEETQGMYQLSNSSLIKGAEEYIETNPPTTTRMTIAPSRNTNRKTPYTRPRGGTKYIGTKRIGTKYIQRKKHKTQKKKTRKHYIKRK
jgi:hypothetical protein